MIIFAWTFSVIMTFFIFLLFFITIIVGGCYFSYQFLIQIIAKYKGQKIFSREFIIFFAIAIPAFWILVYSRLRQPDYFEQGVEQLHNNKYIENKIGGFSSYSFMPDKLPKDPTKQAVFQIELRTSEVTLYLTCTMKKVNDNWKLAAIRQDSTGKNKD